MCKKRMILVYFTIFGICLLKRVPQILYYFSQNMLLLSREEIREKKAWLLVLVFLLAD